LASPGTRGEGQWGWLWYGGQKLPRGEVNDYYRTPWGPIYWVDVPQTNSGMHGWMPVPSGQSPRQGRPLALPAALAAAPPGMPQPPTAPGAAAPSSRQSLEVTKADNGKRARVYVGNVIVVRLPGNPTTGYQWQAVPMPSPVLRLAAQPQYVASPAGVAGGGGTFVFVFQSLQPGAGAIRLVYARPLERDRPAADAFNLSVEVLPSVVSPSTPRTGQPGPNPMGAAAR
jgi:inhibitor of cysteine peptidase